MVTWRYLFHGRVKHAVGRGPNGWVERSAECGAGPDISGDWYGSGTQDEYDRVKELPACKRCLAMGYVYKEES